MELSEKEGSAPTNGGGGGTNFPVDGAAISRARAIVREQAEDEALWFKAETAAEAYIQQELRRLHAAVELPSVVTFFDAGDGTHKGLHGLGGTT